MRPSSTVILLCALRMALSDNWCNHKCGNTYHLRCEHWLLKKNAKCSKIETGFSPYDRMRILDAHNRWRDYVASGLGRVNKTAAEFWLFVPRDNKSLRSNKSLDPFAYDFYPHYRKEFFLWRDDEGQAADMRQLVWDYELERNAAIWASQCNIEALRPYHCAGTAKFKQVHMNMDSSPKPHLSPISGIDSFLRYISYVDGYYDGDRLEVVRSYTPGSWDTFYALIYSQTYAIGCSRALCHCHQDLLPHGVSPGTLTCLYGPSFDHTYSGYKIYEVDKKRCSKCPANTACRPDARYKYLCARPEDPKQPVEIPDDRGFSKQASSILNLCCALAILMVTF